MLALGETAVLGAFCAQDLALFVLFFDLMLVPFYFLIGVWGGPDRVRATTKFVIYTLVGSLLMLAAAVATGILATPTAAARRSSFRRCCSGRSRRAARNGSSCCSRSRSWSRCRPSRCTRGCPTPTRTRPTPVLAVLSGVLSKVGAYGFLRIALPLFPDAAVQYQELLLRDRASRASCTGR